MLFSIIKDIGKYLQLQIFKVHWRKYNAHNNTIAQSYFPFKNVKVGNYTYGPLNIVWMAPNNTKILIGNYCSIGPKVTFLVGGEHDYKRISTWPFQTIVYKQQTDNKLNRDIVIEDDVWIGYDSLIMSGITIGKGSVIGARSIVTKNVPPYSIYIGNQIVKGRFSDNIIERIKDICYDEISHCMEDEYEKFCQVEIDENNIDEVLNSFVGPTNSLSERLSE